MSALGKSSRSRSRIIRGKNAVKFEEEVEHAHEICGVSHLSKDEQDALIAVFEHSLTAPMGVLDTLVVHTMSYKEMVNGIQIRSATQNTINMTEPGIDDPRMGVTEFTSKCPTCKNSARNCPGHMGYIQLPLPIPHPVYVDYLVALLNSICLNCKKPLINEENILLYQQVKYLTGLNRIKKLAELSTSRIVVCSENHQTIKWKFDKESYTLVVVSKGDTSSGRTFTLNEIYDALAAISDEDARLLGFSGLSRPENFILKAIPVIPPNQRQKFKVGRDYTNDPITMEYIDIAKTVFNWYNLPNRMDMNNQNVRAMYMDVYRRLVRLIKEKKSTGGPHAGDLHGSVVSRLNGKEGLIRLRTTAKRTDQNARTVAGPGPNARLGQIVVPEKLARKLSVPEVIRTEEDLARAREWYKKKKVSRIDRGLHTYVITDFNRDNYYPELGDTVHRHLMNGDYVVMNRQPTLTMYSIMGYEVVIDDGLTLRIPLPTTTPHNADFDGDDINIQVPQDPKAMQEARCEMSFVQNLLSSHTASLITGAVMNAKTGMYVLTGDDNWVDYEDYVDYSMKVVHPKNPFDMLVRAAQLAEERGVPVSSLVRLREAVVAVDEPTAERKDRLVEAPAQSINTVEQLRTAIENHSFIDRGEVHGRLVFSLVLPSDFTYSNGGVMIERGVMIKGQLTSKVIGSASNSIGHVIALHYGQEAAAEFITNISWIGEDFLYKYGFSVGAADCFFETEEIKREVDRIVNGVREFVSGAYDREISTEFERLERKVQIQAKSNVMAEVGEAITPYIPPDNALLIMANSGAKGNKTNYAQIGALAGQQYQQAEIPEPTMSGGRRSCPTRSVYDHTPEAFGFCVNSFGKGLTLEELFAHAAATRDSLMGTSIETQKIGYLKRRLEQTMRNAIVDDSHTLVSFGMVLQYVAGNDMFDPKYLKKIVLDNDEFFTPVDVLQEVAILNSEP